MKNLLIWILGLTAASSAFIANAQTYQWKDSSGRTIISDSPPPRTVRASRSLGEAPAPSIGPNTPAEAGKSGEPPKTNAEKDADFKKRQQEAREKSEKAEKELAAARQRQDACDRARRNLAALESDQAISMADETGERQLLDRNQREQEMEHSRRIVAETCR